jgi:hypothetical protein
MKQPQTLPDRWPFPVDGLPVAVPVPIKSRTVKTVKRKRVKRVPDDMQDAPY